jgi:DNA polymerase III sliding clamp (beta) subunit (PCNA family)
MKVELSVQEMRRIIGATIRSISKDESRQALNSLYLSLDGDTLIAASSDGHRLAKYVRKLDGATEGEKRESGSCLVSRYTVEEVQRQIKKMTVGVVRIDSATRSIDIAPSNVRFLYADRSECTFPPIDAVIPTIDEERPGLRWIGIDTRYLADAAAAFRDVLEMKRTEEPAMCVEPTGAELDPIRLTEEGAPELVIVLMPMRVRDPGYPAIKPAPKPASALRLVSNK